MRKILPVIALAAVLAGCGRDEPAGAPGTSTPGAGVAKRGAPASASGLAAIRARLVRGERYAALPDRGELLAYAQGGSAGFRTRAYTWKQVRLSEQHALGAIGGTMTVQSPDGALIRLRYDRHVEHPNGDWTWVGRPAGAKPGTEALITFGEKAVFGSIPDGKGPPLRLMQANGVSWLVKTDPAALASLPGANPTEPDAFPVPRAALLPGADGATPATGNAPATGAAAASASTTVDLVIGYTSGFASRLGGESQANTRLNNIVDFANQAYQNSGIDARVRLVNTVQVNYADNTDNDQALYDLTGYDCSGSSCVRRTIPASLQTLHNARDQYGADLVSLVRAFDEPSNSGCGVAWILGGGQRAISSSDAGWGMSVVSDSNGRGEGAFPSNGYVCRDETLAHELGHNMGSQHDVATARGSNNTLDSNEYGRYPYSFGYKTDASNGNFYTVMAYGDKGQTPYRVFSNPRVAYCGGLACGVEQQADNARSLNQTMPTLATFRAVVVPFAETPAAGQTMVGGPRDLDGDGKPDLLWFNQQTRELYYWTMSGAALRFGGSSGFLPEGHAPVGVADFNADGLSDVLVTGAASVHVWTGNGRGQFQAARVGELPQGWDVAALRDIDGDGKDDVLWFQSMTGEIYYWLMSGNSVRMGRGGVYAPAGATPRAVADFNGDGRADIVLASSRDIWVYIGNASGTFTSGYVAAYPLTWRLVGAGDMNADSRADLVWHHPETGELYYWLQNGATIVSGRGGVYGPIGSSPIAMADFSADRRADVMFATDAHIWTYVATSSGDFSSGYTYARPAGWRVVQ